MATKWKKCRIIVSFAAFFLGMTLLLTNFFTMLGLLAQADLQAGTDYQKTEEFAGFISGRLETLVSAAAGGEDWHGSLDSYGTAYEAADVYVDSWSAGDFQVADLFRLILNALGITSRRSYTVSTTETATHYDMPADGEGGQSYRDFYMEELAADRNVRFAVLYQGELLYTNLDGLTAQTVEASGIPDFAALLPEGEYNFSLCYNRNGDGKTEIVKDGQEVDVYGDGTYGPDSRWRVPGYENFQAEGKARDVVVFLAAAKEPMLEIDNYGMGTEQRGGTLFYMRAELYQQRQQLRETAARLGAALLLLLLAFWLRASLREARQRIGGWFKAVWVEIKALLFWCLPVLWLVFAFLTKRIWYWNLSGAGLAVYFWLFYFGLLDRKYNHGRQKSFLRSIRNSLRTRDLKRPLQKRLVGRQWLVFAPGLLLFLLLCGFLLIYGRWLYWNDALAPVLTMFCFAVLLLIGGLAYMKKNRRMAEDIGALTDRIAAVREGRLSGSLKLPEDADLKEAAENLNEISQGLEKALKERTRSERMKVELIANVSHDLKTPLTSIVSYIELLKQEAGLPEHVRDYIRILEGKAARLQGMVQDVFEVSKAASGQLPVKIEKLDFAKLLRQTLADMSVQIEQSGFALRAELPDGPVEIRADGQRLYRVFQNLLQNALQYSLPGSRIYLALSAEGGRAQAVVKNTSAAELLPGTDFTERFVRGDESRTDGGSGLGLSIARSFTEACGGELKVKTDADLFTVTVTFPVEGA